MASPRLAEATVLLSGGLDSSACAHFLLRRGLRVRGLFINHGQAAARHEEAASAALAKQLAVPIEVYALTGSRALSVGELVGRNAMLIFNALFLTKAASDLLAIGVHAGTPYYDCSSAFVAAAARLVSELTDGRVILLAPFLEWSKKDIFDYFVAAGLPIELTYSCEAGTDPACGICASCRDRKALGC
jgi:7-cyano-7-deazaguanine synthase